MSQRTLRCLEVRKNAAGQVELAAAQRPLTTPGGGELLIRVAWSSLNYKDALATTGHPGVVKRFPLVPGIDAAGVVVESRDARFQQGDAAIVTSYDLGVARDGGWGEYLHAPADWAIPLPAGLTAREAMILGTAGLTAGLCVQALIDHGVTPASGDVLVTGASGGVGSLAVRLLAQLGFPVVAVSGKLAQAKQLQRFGAREVLSRAAVVDTSSKPLLPTRWAGVVDTVGGATLATAIRQTLPNGCIAACGLVGGDELPLSVYPFILRGVTLAGIDSAYCVFERRAAMWNKLAGEWKLKHLEEGVTEATLDELPHFAARMLKGEVAGRVIVKLA
jgi:acrylyl-CoA reductase (NADPH)